MRTEGGVIDIDRVEERIKCVGARSMKRAIEIVCARQRYRATDLPERQRAEGKFVCGKET
jgi:hypothetical protein